VRNNNNIVTRNLILTNLMPGNQVSSTHWVTFKNATDKAMSSVRLVVMNEKALNPHLGGDLSAVVETKLYLGDLYDRWAAGGSQGSGFTVHESEKSVTFDGAATLELSNIYLNGLERFPIQIVFTLRNPDAEVPESRFIVHFVQYDDNDRNGNTYGAVNFAISTHPAAEAPASRPSAVSAEGQPSGGLSVYPNPAGNTVTLYLPQVGDTPQRVTVWDMYGRRLIFQEKQPFRGGAAVLDVRALAAGVYIVKVSDGQGWSKQQKFIKK
jgi:hypothetical protein